MWGDSKEWVREAGVGSSFVDSYLCSLSASHGTGETSQADLFGERERKICIDSTRREGSYGRWPEERSHANSINLPSKQLISPNVPTWKECVSKSLSRWCKTKETNQGTVELLKVDFCCCSVPWKQQSGFLWCGSFHGIERGSQNVFNSFTCLIKCEKYNILLFLCMEH